MYILLSGEESLSAKLGDINTLGQELNGCNFEDDVFKFIFFYDNCCIFIQVSLELFQKDPINKKPAVV